MLNVTQHPTRSRHAFSYSQPFEDQEPCAQVLLGYGVYDDQVIFAERYDSTWEFVLEENGSELARFAVSECDLMDIVLGQKWNWYHVEIRTLKHGLQIKVAGELFAMLQRPALLRLTRGTGVPKALAAQLS